MSEWEIFVEVLWRFVVGGVVFVGVVAAVALILQAFLGGNDE